MNFQLIGQLIRLRYKLMWAKTRTRNGKIALFFSGYLLLVMVGMIFAAGGFGAGAAAVKSGKGTLVASVVLGGLFVQALLATVILGFGVNEIFADIELRRYPLRLQEREVARHFLGLVDPFWILVLVLDFGLLAGLYLFGVGSFWLGLLAVLLLYVCNYLCARVLSVAIDRLVSKKGGNTVLLAAIMAIAFLPGLVEGKGHQNNAALNAWLHRLTYTPPAGAAAAMTHADWTGLRGLAIVVWWLVGLAVVLVALERRPAQSKSLQKTKMSWDSPFERIGALFGPEYAILVGQWLRFYSRNARFRMIYPLAVPIIALLVKVYTKQGAFGHDTKGQLLGAMGGFACIGFMGTAQFAVNQFGYVGSGLRRYMLLPTDPAAVLRAGSYTFLLLSSVLIPVAAVIWLIFAPVPPDARTMAALVSCSLMGMFLMNAIALWVTLLAPRRGNYYHTFGNDLSFFGNIAVIGGLFLMLFIPRLLAMVWPGAVSPANWWAFIALAAAAFLLYRMSLGAASAAFRARREQLLGVMEGRV